MRYILKNCRLIPELSAGYSHGQADVIINKSIIESVSQETEVSRRDQVIDCMGKTLLPGLFDLHMHMNWAYLNGEIRLDDFKILIQSCNSAKKYLEHGITTVRDLGSPRRVAIAVRDAIRQGLFVGPRILGAGLILNPVSRVCALEKYLFLRHASGSDEFLRAAREEIGCGADYVKLYAPGEPTTLLPEELAAAIRIAELHHKKVAVHAHDRSAIHMCLDKGVHTIEHGSFIDDAGIEKLKQENSYLVPTLSVLSHLIATPGFTQEQKKKALRPLLDANAKNITAAYKAGLKLGFGTDSPIEELDKFPGLEFRMRKEYCGMSNTDLLLQATKYSAEITNLQHVTGEVRVGLAADLILVDGNPDECIEVMYHKPEIVFANGVKVNSK